MHHFPLRRVSSFTHVLSIILTSDFFLARDGRKIFRDFLFFSRTDEFHPSYYYDKVTEESIWVPVETAAFPTSTFWFICNVNYYFKWIRKKSANRITAENPMLKNISNFPSNLPKQRLPNIKIQYQRTQNVLKKSDMNKICESFVYI